MRYIAGLRTRARPIATRCISPPESAVALLSSLREIRKTSATSFTLPLGASYARHEAPVLRLASLQPSQAFFLVSAQQYNHESEPVYASFFAVALEGKLLAEAAVPFAEIAAKIGLAGELINPGKGSSRIDLLRSLVPAVIARARDIALAEREVALNPLRSRARKETRRVAAWEERALAAITARRKRHEGTGRIPPFVEKRLIQEEAGVRRERKNHEAWLEQLKSAGPPYLRLVAVFSGE